VLGILMRVPCERNTSPAFQQRVFRQTGRSSLARGPTPACYAPSMAAARERRRRPNGPQAEGRSRQMGASVTRSEYEAYDAAAARLDLTLAAWARRALTAAVGGPVEPRAQQARGRNGNTGPASGEVRATPLGIKLTQDEWDAYHAEVRRLGTTRTEWVRRLLNAAARQGPRASRPLARRRRPNLPPEERRSTRLIVRVSRAERSSYRRGAARDGLPLGEWFRRQLFGAIGMRVKSSQPTALRNVSITIYLRAAEQGAIRAEATRARLGMSEWVRRVLNRAAGRITPRR